jgi:predicted ArsR family transcriptional regulator
MTDAELALLQALDGKELTLDELAAALGVSDETVKETLDSLDHNADGSVRRFAGYQVVYTSWMGMLPRRYGLNRSSDWIIAHEQKGGCG